MKELNGKVAVVTGAASGMGLAFARRFSAEGMRVVLADIEAEPLRRAVAELREAGRDALGVVTDVSRLADVQQLADATVAEFGKVHVICNNAGVEGFLGHDIWEAGQRDWEWTFGVNFWSVVYGVQVFLPLLLAHGEEGHLVNTVSMRGVTRPRNMYGVTKHAVLALTEVVEGQLRERGAPVGVTALCPGTVATNLFLGSRNRPEQPSDAAVPDGGDDIRAAMHARLAEGMPPEEVAGQLVEAIRNGVFYLLTDHDWDDQVRARATAILGSAILGSGLTEGAAR
jgi:NAD(P)-dependent dehydrogenase (short-subunit alcohol dehydrogenase family)